MQSVRTGSIGPSPYFGEWCPWKVCQQEPGHQQPYSQKQTSKFQKKGNRNEHYTNNNWTMHTHDQFTIYQQCFIPYLLHVTSPNSRPTTTLLPQFAMNNCQPLSATGSPGLQTRNDINPKPTVPSKTLGYQEQSPTRCRNTEVNRQGGSNKGPSLSKSVPKPNLPGSQERWVIQTSNQPEISELAHKVSLFQDGEPSDDERSVKTRQLDGFNRL